MGGLGLGSRLSVQLLKLLRVIQRISLRLSIDHILIFVVLRRGNGRTARVQVHLSVRRGPLSNVLHLVQHLGHLRRVLIHLRTVRTITILVVAVILRQELRIFCCYELRLLVGIKGTVRPLLLPLGILHLVVGGDSWLSALPAVQVAVAATFRHDLLAGALVKVWHFAMRSV